MDACNENPRSRSQLLPTVLAAYTTMEFQNSSSTTSLHQILLIFVCEQNIVLLFIVLFSYSVAGYLHWFSRNSVGQVAAVNLPHSLPFK